MAKKRNRRGKRRGTAASARTPPLAVRGAGAARTAEAEPAAARRPPPPVESPEVTRLRARTVGSDAWRARVEDQVVVLVNEARRLRGRPRLRIDERLRAAARAHSADMRARQYIGHDAPDGGTPATRMRSAGHPRPAAENVARGQTRPQQVVHAWMGSPGHRANILDPLVRAIGVGIQLGDGGPWWTQNFGYE